MVDGADPAGYDPSGSTVAWRSFHEEAVARLTGAGFESAEVDARRIVEAASGFEGGEFHLGLAELATKRGVVRFDAMLDRRLAGEPLQYVIGSWGFRTLDLMVDRRVLIPRPETEVVAGIGIDLVRSLDRSATVLDLGTGTGAIAFAIAQEVPRATVVATDRSADALALARANLAGIGPAATVSPRASAPPSFEPPAASGALWVGNARRRRIMSWR